MARAEAWDVYLDVQGRESAAEAVRELQRKHQLHLRNAFNKLILATQNVDWSKLTPALLVQLTGELIRLERLVYEQPISVERVQHTSESGGPVAHVVANATFTPSAELMAETMRILADNGALDGEFIAEPDGEVRADPPTMLERAG